jgi:hypothetical protein
MVSRFEVNSQNAKKLLYYILIGQMRFFFFDQVSCCRRTAKREQKAKTKDEGGKCERGICRERKKKFGKMAKAP